MNLDTDMGVTYCIPQKVTQSRQIFCHSYGLLAVWQYGHAVTCRQFGTVAGCHPSHSTKYSAYRSDHPLFYGLLWICPLLQLPVGNTKCI